MKHTLHQISYFSLGIIFAGVAVFTAQNLLAQSALSSTKASDVKDSDRRTQIILQQMNSVKMDDSFFKSAAFASLEDFGITVQPEAFKRSNPFAPFGADASQ